MKLVKVLEDWNLENMCNYIRTLQDTGILVATDPQMPGCIDATTLSNEHRHPVWGKFFFNEQPHPLQRLVDVYLSAPSSLPQDFQPVIQGAAVAFGDRIALYPGDPDGWENMEPVWMNERFTSGYASHILWEIVKRAGRLGIQIFPTALYLASDYRYPYHPIQNNWIELEYVVSNRETRAALVGYALLDHYVVYIHIAGPQQSVKSILASLIQYDRLTMLPGHRVLRGTGNYRIFLSRIPNTSAYRGILVAREALQSDGSCLPDRSYLVIPQGKNHEEARLFALKINSFLPIPVLPEWGKALLEHAKKERLVRRLDIGGDVSSGLAIQTSTDAWIKLINQMLVEGHLVV